MQRCESRPAGAPRVSEAMGASRPFSAGARTRRNQPATEARRCRRHAAPNTNPSLLRSQASSSQWAPRCLQQCRPVWLLVAVVTTRRLRVVCRHELAYGLYASDRAFLEPASAEVLLHIIADRGPPVRVDLRIEPPVGDDFHVVVRKKDIDQDAIVRLGVPDAERREDLERSLAGCRAVPNPARLQR